MRSLRCAPERTARPRADGQACHWEARVDPLPCGTEAAGPFLGTGVGGMQLGLSCLVCDSLSSPQLGTQRLVHGWNKATCA
jgi:hypothetical protein